VSRRAVTWYPEALGDIDAIVDYLCSRGSHINAGRFLDRVEHAVSSLRSAPSRGRIVPELAAYGVDRYRERVVAPWRVIYRVEPRAILVLTIVDSRRALDELLLERLVRAD
jgi:plasmid stabilization system protein ParE